jgi:hypothetical protein
MSFNQLAVLKNFSTSSFLRNTKEIPRKHYGICHFVLKHFSCAVQYDILPTDHDAVQYFKIQGPYLIWTPELVHKKYVSSGIQSL